MKRHCTGLRAAVVLAAVASTLGALPARASIDGLVGQTVFDFTANADYINTGEGNVILFWGLANAASRTQYPAPTLILNQGDVVTVNLTNALGVSTSLVFPGQSGVTAVDTGLGACTNQGILTCEAAPGGQVTYSFTASQPGTFMYHSGTSPELQIDMGLVGAIIVRPSGFDPMAPTAYGTPDSAFDREYLFLMTEMDPRIHDIVLLQGVAGLLAVDYLSVYRPNYWFFNGRNAPDTMFEVGAPYLPTQPYNCMPLMHPGDKVLVRGIGGGRDLHPLHLHGNHFRVFARDGRLLQTAAGPVADLSAMEFTHNTYPGETWDATYEWTGEKLGWDIYGTGPGFAHSCTADANGFDVVTHEYCADHGKPFPVLMPDVSAVTGGRMWSGSPFLGRTDEQVPGSGGMNPQGAYTFMWHSHQERDIVNDDTFPGGMMTMLVIVPPGTPIM